MNRIGWWLADQLSQSLEPSERDAVRGDQAELGTSGTQAAREVLGLVVRRQLQFWRDWRPWLIFAALVAPLGLLLSLATARVASGSAIPIWMYLNNWTAAVLESPGSRGLLVSYGISISSQYLVLACWSWAAGFILGAFSRRTIPVNGVLFCLIVLFASLLPSSLRSASGPNPNAAVFALYFYSVMFPLILQTALVLFPSVWGMRQGRRLAAVPPSLRTLLLATAFVTVAVLAIQNWGWVLCKWGTLQSCRDWVLEAGYAHQVGWSQGVDATLH